MTRINRVPSTLFGIAYVYIDQSLLNTGCLGSTLLINIRINVFTKGNHLHRSITVLPSKVAHLASSLAKSKSFA